MTKLKNSNCETTRKNMLRKLEQSNHDQNYNTKIVTKIQTQTKHKLKYDKTLKLIQQQNSKTKIFTTQNSNCDQTTDLIV